MKNFISKNIIIFSLIPISIMFILLIFHDIFIGTDELRTTYVSKEIAEQGNIYFRDPNNSLFDTDIFVKNGFAIGENQLIYPVAFTINSLILVPFLAINENAVSVFNIYALIVYMLTFLVLFNIFTNLKLNRFLGILGALIFSLTNYNLAMYVSYYPDFVLTLLVLIFINLIIKFHITKRISYLILTAILSGFLLSYKITIYPILVTFFPFYLIYLIKNRVKKSKLMFVFIILVASFFFFNIPQFITNSIGPTYGDLSDENLNIVAPSGNNSSSKIVQLTNRFIKYFLIPKDNGKYLLIHLKEDFLYFWENNVIVFIGFFSSFVFLLRQNKQIAFIVILLFLTSFLLWGNMDVYGGGPIDLSNLRNSHTRYMLPIFTLLYIVGFYFLKNIIFNKFILCVLILFIIIRTILSLVYIYPFSSYSLALSKGYLFDLRNEKRSIEKLSISKDSIFISATYDDYDLGYNFENYANFKLLDDNPSRMQSSIKNFVDSGKRVYLLYPKKDSRFSPLERDDLENLYDYISKNYSVKSIFEDNNNKLLLIS